MVVEVGEGGGRKIRINGKCRGPELDVRPIAHTYALKEIGDSIEVKYLEWRVKEVFSFECYVF